MSEYSSEPWKISDDGAPPCISDSDGNLVAEFVFTFNSNSYETELANGRRIVAAVNALQGVPTEWLEDAVKSGIRDVAQGNLFSSRLALQQQRDKLVGALRGMIAEADRNTDPFIHARALIAEIEASK